MCHSRRGAPAEPELCPDDRNAREAVMSTIRPAFLLLLTLGMCGCASWSRETLDDSLFEGQQTSPEIRMDRRSHGGVI
jgi:hypothetical protein